jgi:hypothetical protein
MPRPTTAQLRKINKFSQVELKEDQVFVFRSLSADTLPVSRYSWFGEYSINMTEKMLQKLKKDYQNGVGLLASHDSSRLPFGRTFDAETMADEVGGESVKTLYIDHYMVTHMEGENGERRALATEIGMSTQEIADHIEVGHTFDTSIGFSIHDPKCSICMNSIRDYENCEHIPGLTYTVEGEEVRCNIVAETGEGVENSLVYAGAVNRALIQKAKKDGEEGSESFSKGELQSTVKLGDTSLYNVDDVKNLPIGAELFCFLSKGNMQLFTSTTERRDFSTYQKGREEMSNANTQTSATEASPEFIQLTADVALMKSEHVTALSAKEGELQVALGKVTELTEQLGKSATQVEELTAKATLADTFTTDLISETVKAGIATRGNAFNKERFEKYLATLSVADIKEELAAMKAELSGSVAEAAAQVTETSVEDGKDAPVQMSKSEMRQEAAKVAMAQFSKTGGNLEELTKLAMAELEAKAVK